MLQALKPSRDHEIEGFCSDASNKPPSPTLDWYALQSGLEHAESDVLILLDSCASAGSSGGSKQSETQEGGTTELLAACGFETVAPGPGPHSFTNALIKELREMSTLDSPFAVNMLHQRIIARLVHYSPQYTSEGPPMWTPGPGQSPLELRATPVYIFLGRDFRQKSIPLRSFSNLPSNGGGPLISSSGSIGNPKAAKTDESQTNDTISAIKRLLGDCNAPKVLLAINLEGEHWGNFEHHFATWLQDMPAPADSINIEAVFHGLSNMILLSMPIAIWDLFPEHPSCSFVSFVQSSNLLPSPMSLVHPRKKKTVYEYVRDIVSLHPAGGLVAPHSEILNWLLQPSCIFYLSICFILTLYTLLVTPLCTRIIGSNMPWYDIKQCVSAEDAGLWVSPSSGRDTEESAIYSLLTIFMCSLIAFNPDDVQISHFLRIFTPEYTFAIAAAYVIDAGLSARGMREYAYKDGVRWTLSHARYAAMGGFVAQRPATVTPLPLSSMELLQMRRLGYLKRTPDIEATQNTKNSNSSVGYTAVFWVGFFFVQSLFQWRGERLISPLEIIAIVFATYTGLTYALLGSGFFYPRPSTTLSLWDAKHFWSSVEDDERFAKILQTNPNHYSWIADIATDRLLPKALFDPRNMTFWLGLMVGCLISGTLQAIAWDYHFPTSMEHILWKASVSLSFALSAGLLVLVIFQPVLLGALSSDRMDSILATVGSLVRWALFLQRLYLWFEAFHSLIWFPIGV